MIFLDILIFLIKLNINANGKTYTTPISALANSPAKITPNSTAKLKLENIVELKCRIPING